MSEKKRIGIFRKQILPYSETFIINQSLGIARFEVELFGMKEIPGGLGNLDKFILKNLSKRGLLFFKYLNIMSLDLISQVKSRNYSLIHAHFGPDALLILPIARRLSVPLVSTFHGYDVFPLERDLGVFYRLYELKRKHVFFYSSKVIAVSRYVKLRLVELGCPEIKIQVHYIGVDTEYFSPIEIKKENIILYVGRIIKQKGVLDLIEAVQILAAKNKDFRVVIIGTGNNIKDMQEYVKNNSLPIAFLGKKTPAEIREWMSRSKLLCVPSLYEALGTVYAEAQAMEIPVVAYNHGGVPEVVENDVTGFLGEPKNIKKLVENIEKLLDDENLRVRMGKKGREKIVREFNLKTQSLVLDDIYANILNEEENRE